MARPRGLEAYGVLCGRASGSSIHRPLPMTQWGPERSVPRVLVVRIRGALLEWAREVPVGWDGLYAKGALTTAVVGSII